MKGEQAKKDFAVKVGSTYQVQGFEDPMFICGIKREYNGGFSSRFVAYIMMIVFVSFLYCVGWNVKL